VIRKNTPAQQLLLNQGRNHICGVTLLDRHTQKTYTVKTPLVISNVGPSATLKLCHAAGLSTGAVQSIPPPPTATGLKVQVLSPKSLINHASIMFCLDTRRIAGIVQISNLDPDLAPPGKHLLISHQVVPQHADWRQERQLALQDWRDLFAADFDNCQVLGTSHFSAHLPVNWAAQGHDWRQQIFAGQGLWMVGDGMKPEGLIMVEGVAASAESVVRHILGAKDTAPWQISRFTIWVRQIHSWLKDSVRAK
jgi:phytoene dehydrogenase-like protein